jgi:hypothetical protein
MGELLIAAVPVVLLAGAAAVIAWRRGGDLLGALTGETRIRTGERDGRP